MRLPSAKDSLACSLYAQPAPGPVHALAHFIQREGHSKRVKKLSTCTYFRLNSTLCISTSMDNPKGQLQASC